MRAEVGGGREVGDLQVGEREALGVVRADALGGLGVQVPVEREVGDGDVVLLADQHHLAELGAGVAKGRGVAPGTREGDAGLGKDGRLDVESARGQQQGVAGGRPVHRGVDGGSVVGPGGGREGSGDYISAGDGWRPQQQEGQGEGKARGADTNGAHFCSLVSNGPRKPVFAHLNDWAKRVKRKTSHLRQTPSTTEIHAFRRVNVLPSPPSAGNLSARGYAQI